MKRDDHEAMIDDHMEGLENPPNAAEYRKDYCTLLEVKYKDWGYHFII